MIELTFNDQNYTYDIYHIVKTFFPDTEITQKISTDESAYVDISIREMGIKFAVYPEDVEKEKREDKKERKHEINILIYQWLSQASGKEAAWGILTGIRPTKIAMNLLEEGKSKEEILRHYREHDMVSEEKALLGYEIALKEKELLSQLDYDNGYSLYIGIPFCPTTCSYCSFTSYPIEAWKDRVDEYLEALMKELTFIGEISKEKKLNTVYMGGGTPTTLTPAQLDRLLTHAEQTFSYDDLKEITVEAGRPDSITREKLKVLRDHKINRISINPQTMQQRTLDIIGRKHTVEDIIRVYKMAREEGFDNINMDLIAGLPGEVPWDMRNTMEQIEALAPDSITVHSLALKRASRLGQEKKQKIRTGETAETDSRSETQKMAENLSEMIQIAQEYAQKMGLVPYYMYRQKNIAGNFENVGYAKVDKAGIYNILIMEEKQTIIAAGAGASTKAVLPNKPEYGSDKSKRIERAENVKDVSQYIARIDEMIERKGELLWH